MASARLIFRWINGWKVDHDLVLSSMNQRVSVCYIGRIIAFARTALTNTMLTMTNAENVALFDEMTGESHHSGSHPSTAQRCPGSLTKMGQVRSLRKAESALDRALASQQRAIMARETAHALLKRSRVLQHRSLAARRYPRQMLTNMPAPAIRKIIYRIDDPVEYPDLIPWNSDRMLW